jgi:hypothetical protein
VADTGLLLCESSSLAVTSSIRKGDLLSVDA